jgi:hypothetical protein
MPRFFRDRLDTTARALARSGVRVLEYAHPAGAPGAEYRDRRDNQLLAVADGSPTVRPVGRLTPAAHELISDHARALHQFHAHTG